MFGEQVPDEALAHRVIDEAYASLVAVLRGDRRQALEEIAGLVSALERLMTAASLTWEDVRAVQHARDLARDGFAVAAAVARPPRLFTGLDNPLLDALQVQLFRCSRAYMAVSFVMQSGVERLIPALTAALQRGAAVRLLTSDYLDITEPDALELLLALPGDLAVRAYIEPGRSYHAKAYIFEHADGRGVAYIGSSNLSAAALAHGVEWNYEVKEFDVGWPLVELVAKFNALFNSPHSVPVDAAYIADYRRRRKPRTQASAEGTIVPLQRPRPWPAQVEALAQLEAIREEGEQRAMVIAATGIGKTFLAAFDSAPSKRVLFLAHREELLTQAQWTFSQVRPETRIGLYVAGKHDAESDILCASVATLSRPEYLNRFAPDHFDYIVVDEFHHAAASSYLTILHYFAPRFLLGLTATPYRGDNRDIFAICDGNVAYRVTFLEAIAFGWLCPFHYFGIYDETNYAGITWRNGRYDQRELSRTLENRARAEAILKAYRDHPALAALGFCVSIEHARYMADFFDSQGIPALAVHYEADSPDRTDAIEKLTRGEVKVLFTVDLFNEGVDIPVVDLVLFLRPTESVTIFLQQLGRGLRLDPGKIYLTVLDFIGNYKKAHFKPYILAGRVEGDPNPSDIKKILAEYASGELAQTLPPGVKLHFDLQVINLMQKFALEKEPLRRRLETAYREVAETLGHRPSMLELHRWGQYNVRQYRQQYGSWFSFLRTQDALTPAEIQLESQVGGFLCDLEKTEMTKSYKMVILQAFIELDGLTQPVPVGALVARFRQFFLYSPRHARDIVGTEIADLKQVSDNQLHAYLEKNPLAAWTNPGKSGKRKVYFAYDQAAGNFCYQGPQASDIALFKAAVLERAMFRLAEYFEIRFERKNVFKVINNGDRGMINLGDDESAPIPRNAGWKTVLINGNRMYAKFVKVAIYVLKDEPSDNKGVPNRLTEILEGWFGPGGYLPQNRNFVRISPVVDNPDLWIIEPARQLAGAAAPPG